MKLSSIILFTVVGNTFAQPQTKGPEAPKQDLNSIAQCIDEKKCGNDLTCQQKCLGSNNDIVDSILKNQKCISSCDTTMPIDQYQKCVLLCNTNGGQPPSFPQKEQPTSKDDSKPTSSDSSPTPTSADSGSKPTSGSPSSASGSSNASGSSKSSNGTSQGSSASSNTSGSSSITKLSTSAMGLLLITVFSNML
jgi:cobalamin biosynthesis Mg chelatase CobN